MNQKLRKMLRRLESAGATVGMRNDLPDDIAEMFLQQLVDCPDCAAALKAAEAKPSTAPNGGKRSGH